MQQRPVTKAELRERAHSAQVTAVMACLRSQYLIHKIGGTTNDPDPCTWLHLASTLAQRSAVEVVDHAGTHMQLSRCLRQLQRTRAELAQVKDANAILREQLAAERALRNDTEVELAYTLELLADLNQEIQAMHLTPDRHGLAGLAPRPVGKVGHEDGVRPV